jgi:hypothetical protein
VTSAEDAAGPGYREVVESSSLLRRHPLGAPDELLSGRPAAGTAAPTMSDPARTTPGPSQARLALKPGMPRTGAVDGAWWPHSRDLVAEVPALVAAFPATAGRVQRVGFGRSMWDAVPQRVRGWADGRRIGLDGFAAFAADVVWVATSITGSAPLFLLVVPPDTAPEVADGILRRAGSAENLETPADLLAGSVPAAGSASPGQQAMAASHG